jgi:hypothetical protein
VLAILAPILPVGRVRGDVGPSFLKNEHFPALRFDNLADYPDFDFYLKYARGPGNPYGSPYLAQVRSGEVFHQFEGSGRKAQEVFLLAVPRGQHPPSPQRGHEWLMEAPPGCLQSSPLDGTNVEAGYLVRYRVQVQDGRLEVAKQGTDWLLGEWLLQWLPCFVVPLAACLAAAWLGVRIARRLPRPKQTGLPQPEGKQRQG